MLKPGPFKTESLRAGLHVGIFFFLTFVKIEFILSTG